MTRSRCHFVVVALLATALGSCSTKPEGASGSRQEEARPAGVGESGGGLWDQLRKSREDKESRVAAQADIDKKLEAGRANVPMDWQVKMNTWWGHFLGRDPSWVTSMKEWQALGPVATDILVENLLQVLVIAYDNGNGVMHKEAASALYELSDASIRYLVECLAGHFGDDVVRQHCVDLLSRIGAKAVPSIEKAYGSAEEAGKFDLLRATSRMGTDAATPLFTRAIRDEDDFKLRIAAIEGLGKSADPRGATVLIECLRDQDVSVRKFSAGYVSAYGNKAAVKPLIDCLLNAESKANATNGEAAVAANCVQSLRFLTKQSFRNGREWDAWWRRSNGN